MARRYEPDPEPICIGLDVIVSELMRLGRPRMADFVNDFRRNEERLIAEARHYKKLYEDIQGPLECRPREKRFDPTPPPEASD